MTDNTNGTNGRVTVTRLYEELQPMKDDITHLKVDVGWLKWGVLALAGALIANAAALVSGPTAPKTAEAAWRFLFG